MTKKRIQITEEELHNIIQDCVKRVLNETTYKGNIQKLAKSEFHNFAGLAKEDTGLGVDIFLDQCNSYKEFEHPFWLYFRNGYGNLNSFVPITIEDKKVLFGKEEMNIYHKDILGVIRFIDAYYDDIHNIAEGEMDVFELYQKIKRLSESTSGQRVLLTEMAKLSNEITGLPFDVWVGTNNKKHWVGVKFAPDNSTRRSSDFPEMSVANCEIISKREYEAWRADYVKALIEANKEALMELGRNPQLYAQVCANLTKIGADLKPIVKEPDYYPAGECKFGFTKVKNKEGKFNFIDKNGQLVSDEYWFDVANDFVKNQNGIVRAYTILNGTEGFLYLNPIKWEPAY